MNFTEQDRIDMQIRAEAYQMLHDLAVNPITPAPAPAEIDFFA